MVKAKYIKNGLGGGLSSFFNIFMSFFRKIGFKWSITAIIIAVIFGNAITESIKEENPVIFVEDFMGRVFLSDNKIEVETKKFIENPENKQDFQDLKPVDSSVGFFTRMINYVNNGWVNIKNFLSKFKIFYSLFASLWFLYMMTWVLYKFNLFIVLQDDSKKSAAVVLAVLMMVAFQSIFSAATYENGDWSKLTMEEKANKIKPFRGTLYFFSNLDSVINSFKTNIVDNMNDYNVTDAVDVVNNNQKNNMAVL